jgi:hypothetical protein
MWQLRVYVTCWQLVVVVAVVLVAAVVAAVVSFR